FRHICLSSVIAPVQFFFFSSRRRHTRFSRDWSSDVCSSDLSPKARLNREFTLAPFCHAPEERAGKAGAAARRARLRANRARRSKIGRASSRERAKNKQISKTEEKQSKDSKITNHSKPMARNN